MSIKDRGDDKVCKLEGRVFGLDWTTRTGTTYRVLDDGLGWVGELEASKESGRGHVDVNVRKKEEVRSEE